MDHSLRRPSSETGSRPDAILARPWPDEETDRDDEDEGDYDDDEDDGIVLARYTRWLSHPDFAPSEP
jgi:hypothetical protein